MSELNQETVAVEVRIHTYAPRVFKFLRAVDHINEIDIMKSVKPQMNKM